METIRVVVVGICNHLCGDTERERERSFSFFRGALALVVFCVFCSD